MWKSDANFDAMENGLTHQIELIFLFIQSIHIYTIRTSVIECKNTCSICIVYATHISSQKKKQMLIILQYAVDTESCNLILSFQARLESNLYTN